SADLSDVPPDEVLELARPDRARVAVAADADRAQRVVGLQRAGPQRGHAPVEAVEAVGLTEEVRRRLARAADAGELDHVLRAEAELVADLDDLVGDRVVAAALAQRRGRGGVVGLRQADEVKLLDPVHQSALPLRWASTCRCTQSAVSGMPSM